jgi:hypothetical protein
MKWKLEYTRIQRNVKDHRASVQGRNRGQDLRESTSEAIALGKEQGTSRFLVDATEIELSAPTFDLYDLPAQYEAEGADRRGCLALVLPKLPKEKKDEEFYETVCNNRGWNVRSFPKPDEAIRWLTAPYFPQQADTGKS